MWLEGGSEHDWSRERRDADDGLGDPRPRPRPRLLTLSANPTRPTLTPIPTPPHTNPNPLLNRASCVYFFIGRETGNLGPNTWFGQHPKLANLSLVERYVYTFYWAIVTVRRSTCVCVCVCVCVHRCVWGTGRGVYDMSYR